MKQEFYENPAEVAGAQAEGQDPQLKKGLVPVNGTNQVINEPQENPELETPEAAEPVGGDDEVVDEPQDNSEPTAQEAAEPVDGDAVSESDEVEEEVESPQGKNLLRRYTIYSMTDLKAQGFKFGKLKINRSIKDRALTAKKKSIEIADGLISPCLVVSARKCKDEGLEICFFDDSTIDEKKENLDKILIIVDGQHRFEAIKKLNEKEKKNAPERGYECYFFLPLNQNAKTISILRESNVATAPWKGGDYLTNLLLTAPEGIDTSMLIWVKERFKDCGDTASWLWATLDPSRIYSKFHMVKASSNPDLLVKMAKMDNFENGKKLYEAALDKFKVNVVKLKVVPLTFIDISKKLQAKRSMNDVTEILVEFIKQIQNDSVAAIQGYKRDDKGSKDVKIEKKLNELWSEFEAKNGIVA